MSRSFSTEMKNFMIRSEKSITNFSLGRFRPVRGWNGVQYRAWIEKKKNPNDKQTEC